LKRTSDPAERVIENLEYMINLTEVPELNLEERIVEEMNKTNTVNRHRHRKSGMMKKAAAISGIAAALGLGVVGSGFVSPAMASALSQVPLIGNVFQQYGDAGLQAGVKQGLYQPVDAADSHGGITLKSTGYIYDGTRISVALQREGKTDDGLLGEILSNGDRVTGGKGVIKDIKMLVNGENYFVGRYILEEGENGDSAILNFNDSLPFGTGTSGHPGDLGRPALGESFELTLQVNMTGADQPYVLKFPVKKNTENLVLNPQSVKSHDGFSLTLDKLELTPISTRLTMTGEGEFKSLGEEYQIPDKYLYAGKHAFGVHIFDENNNRVDDLYENSMNIIDGKYHIDFLFTPFKEKPKSLTMKPYVQKVDRSSGKFGEKEYISELEFKVDLK